METTEKKVSPTRSFTACIENNTSLTQRVRVLFPNAKKEENYGNPKGVTLTGLPLDEDSTPESAYDALLHVLSGTQTIIGTIFATAINVNAQVQQPIIVHTDDITKGQYHGARIHMLKDPYQNQSDGLVNRTPFILNNSDGSVAGLIINVLPNAKACYYLYTESTISQSKEETSCDSPDLIRVLPIKMPTPEPIKKSVKKSVPAKKSAPKKSAVKAK